MRLSLILLVAAAAFVAILDSTAAATDANVVNAVNPINVQESIAINRFLRTRKEEDTPVDDEEDDEDDEEEERMFAAMADKARAIKAAAKLAGKSGDDLMEAVTKLDRSEVNALFSQGKSHVANLVPGFHSGISLDDFVAAMKSAGLSDEVESVLMVSYSKYLAHNM
ncbi:hypothetical protein V7S43_010452 [Phytophthora oleae]|uniref:RxLR effector protein n=1 Tax=Phytophthora oleae TaxID=2107226 RepID=A0ABD3FD60_9STRA